MGKYFRLAGILLFLLLWFIWLVGGARVGFTMTSVAEEKIDEVTGLSYPEYRDALLPGVEFPATGILALVIFYVASAFVDRRAGVSKTKQPNN